jgi:protein TonB
MPALSTPRDRSLAAAGAAIVVAAIGAALILGLGLTTSEGRDAALALFTVVPDPPPPDPVVPDPARSRKPEGEASPPNLKAQPTEIVAPVTAPTPQPVAAAPIAGVGSDPSAGAAAISGPGTGAGGEGDGRGSGGDGDGTGGGDGDDTPPIWRSGRLKFSDYPAALTDTGIGGTVAVRYLVWTDGRVTKCDVTRSSGNALLDATTCRLIRERFRFRPSRDPRGKPVPAILVENHEWDAPAPPPEPAQPRRRRFSF